MTNKVTISKTVNSVTITDAENTVTVQVPKTNTVTATSTGPAGPAGASHTINETGKVDKSIVYWDGSANIYKANSTWTVSTLVHGGNF
tara:strand:+ start:544 stop:807 length:264 start_codon:yes stop_codon:yes gene_type:complete